MWKNYTVTELKAIAVKYNHIHKIAGVAKMKREMLIDTLEKITEFKGGKLHIKAAHGGEEIKAAGKPRVVAVYSATGKEGEHKKVEKKKDTKVELAELEKKSEMKKKIKAQGEGAKADAAAIKPPEMKKETLETEKEKAIKILTNYSFKGINPKKKLIKFIDENIKDKNDLYKWLWVFADSDNNPEHLYKEDIVRIVFGVKIGDPMYSTPEASSWLKVEKHTITPEHKTMAKKWKEFRDKTLSKKDLHLRHTVFDENN